MGVGKDRITIRFSNRTNRHMPKGAETSMLRDFSILIFNTALFTLACVINQ